MIIQIIKEGEKNFSILVKGMVHADFLAVPILDLAKVKPPREGWKGLRLDSAVWAIQEKLGLYLWWDKPDGEKTLALVMESRNGLRYDEGILSPRKQDGWNGILYLSSFNCDSPAKGVKAYSVVLDFDKQ